MKAFGYKSLHVLICSAALFLLLSSAVDAADEAKPVTGATPAASGAASQSSNATSPSTSGGASTPSANPGATAAPVTATQSDLEKRVTELETANRDLENAVKAMVLLIKNIGEQITPKADIDDFRKDLRKDADELSTTKDDLRKWRAWADEAFSHIWAKLKMNKSIELRNEPKL